MERKIISAQTKAEILREMLENQVPAAELCERYQVNINSIYNWRKQLFESAIDVFRCTQQKHSQKDQSAITALHEKLRNKDAIIAELAEDNIALKKRSNGMS